MVRGAFALLAPLAATTAPTAASAACTGILPVATEQSQPARAISTRDLIEMREIGSPDSASFASPSPFAVSPDGTRVAYVVNQANLAANGYCRALVVSVIRGAAPPRAVDRGGELIKLVDVQQGFYLPAGATAVVVPVWSPDGRSLAYLRRDAGRTRAWVAAADGSSARPVSQAEVDVVAVAWSGDGTRLIYGTQKDQAALERAIDAEGQRGWLYDERVTPEISARPRLRATDARDVFAADLATGQVRPAQPEDDARLRSAPPSSWMVDPASTAPDGRRAWVERDAASPMAPSVLMAAGLAGTTIRCGSASCSNGILSIWWDQGAVLFLRREGWNKGTMALYRWKPGPKEPVAVLRTEDVLHGCVMAPRELVCTRENSRTPRRVVAIDVRSGAGRELFDPNPEFAGIRLGQVRRLEWRNAYGLEAWGDLVLPPDYRPGTRLPMVVVQYHSDGFLRGGTGDEYPIFLLAERGFAVLSVERVPFFASAFPDLKSWDAIIAVNQKDWSERRSLLSSVLTGVRLAIDQGYADLRRVGITGLSDGASTVAFALIHSGVFAAAAMSTCCTEPNTTMTYGGIAWADWLRSIGYPSATSDDRAFWRDMSLAQNAARIDTPLLMQLSDVEFRLGLEAFSALREQGKPVEMYVFPDEAHTKWQPVHRRAVYERNLDWFSFWLQGREDAGSAKGEQYARWRRMREAARQRPEAAANPAREPRPQRRPVP
ncbi:Atxe2 family lasso peptide isopeptidase [Sphingomonas cannabina]|uniref:Atxe2 family lasso peptide isopeptidase n=1 Tax=Sphingomonas cannabina TaxID=2899123 RepID=UPI001F18E8A2|nr:Atxe2 family lasso peptide isopeptidase [Sphingomonas cannabina]UIJ46343.1 Atxe2 family lasso peptide isopeptidase [Sphingomonas cannabina]